MGQMWHHGAPRAAMPRYSRHLLRATPAAGLSSPPCWEGNERRAACCISVLRKIQQIKNPPSLLSVIHSTMQKCSLYLENGSEILLHFSFSDALDYWRYLIHTHFCHLYLMTYILITQVSELSEKWQKIHKDAHDLSWHP